MYCVVLFGNIVCGLIFGWVVLVSKFVMCNVCLCGKYCCFWWMWSNVCCVCVFGCWLLSMCLLVMSLNICWVCWVLLLVWWEVLCIGMCVCVCWCCGVSLWCWKVKLYDDDCYYWYWSGCFWFGLCIDVLWVWLVYCVVCCCVCVVVVCVVVCYVCCVWCVVVLVCVVVGVGCVIVG